MKRVLSKKKKWKKTSFAVKQEEQINKITQKLFHVRDGNDTRQKIVPRA